MNKGICFGVSVGPGDPELLTLKAVKVLMEADVIFLPSAPKENCKVYRIIKEALPDIDEDKYVCVVTGKMANPKMQGERYDTLACQVQKYLDDGKNVAFPALGEVCIYSTYFYVHERLVSNGYECRLLSGVSSIQEIADRLKISLAQDDTQIHIFPDTRDLEERLKVPGTKVFMKPKSDLQNTVQVIKEYVLRNQNTECYGMSNCGTDTEIIASGVDELHKLSGYMTVIIVK